MQKCVTCKKTTTRTHCTYDGKIIPACCVTCGEIAEIRIGQEEVAKLLKEGKVKTA